MGEKRDGGILGLTEGPREGDIEEGGPFSHVPSTGLHLALLQAHGESPGTWPLALLQPWTTGTR